MDELLVELSSVVECVAYAGDLEMANLSLSSVVLSACVSVMCGSLKFGVTISMGKTIATCLKGNLRRPL